MSKKGYVRKLEERVKELETMLANKPELPPSKSRIVTVLDTGIATPVSVYTEAQVHEIVRQEIERERTRIVSQLNELNQVFDALNLSLARIDIAKEQIYTALLFVAAPDWNEKLKKLQDGFNSQVTASIQLIRKLTESRVMPNAKENAAYLESSVKEFAGVMNDAIHSAIGNSDVLMLQVLANTNSSSLTEILQARWIGIETDYIGRDRRISRAGVYIGMRCNQLDQQGIKGIRRQLKTLYGELKPNRDQLEGDKKEAWDYLESREFASLSRKELRSIEQETSRFKVMMQEIAESANSRQTHDN